VRLQIICVEIRPVLYYIMKLYCIYYDYGSKFYLSFFHAGICNSKHGTSYGQANANLIWQQGGPYLNYTNGDLCENGMRHYTIIGFFCEPQGLPSRPLLVKESSCQTIIHWNTDLVCEKKVSMIRIFFLI